MVSAPAKMVKLMESRRPVLAAALASVVTAALAVPILAFFVMTKQHPANWLAVIIPNALLLFGAWLITFFVVRFASRSRNDH